MMFSPANTTGDTARLEDYLRAISARKWVVVGAALAFTALATYYAGTRNTTYEGTATVVLAPTPVGGNNGGLVQPNLEKEREIILSNPTAAGAVDLVGDPEVEPRSLLTDTTVTFVPNSDVMTIDYLNSDPELAAAYATALAESYVTDREGAALAYYQSQLDLAEAELAQLEVTSAELTSEIQALGREKEAVKNDDTLLPETQATQLSDIDDQLTTLRAERANVTAQIREIEKGIRTVESTLASRSPAAQVLRTAEPPTNPQGISTRLLQFGGLMLGLLFGIVLAFLLERLDTTARDDSSVALALNTTVIGSIPSLGFKNQSGRSSLVMLTTGGAARVGAARESFRRLRSSIEFRRSADAITSILVTSATPAEGKSVVSGNLAIALAQAGHRVALVSADLRRPSQENRFGIDNVDHGLAEYLGGSAELPIVDIPDVANLWIIPAGTVPTNPGELLGSKRFTDLVDELEGEVDFVIVDSPPLLSTADAVSAARSVDGVVIVVDSRRTESNELLQVRADLERTGAALVGAVLNKRKYRRGNLLRRDRYSYHAPTATEPQANSTIGRESELV